MMDKDEMDEMDDLRDQLTAARATIRALKAKLAEAERNLSQIKQARANLLTKNALLKDRGTRLTTEVVRLRKALETIRNAYWTEGEDMEDRIIDLRGIADEALAPQEQEPKP